MDPVSAITAMNIFKVVGSIIVLYLLARKPLRALWIFLKKLRSEFKTVDRLQSNYSEQTSKPDPRAEAISAALKLSKAKAAIVLEYSDDALNAYHKTAAMDEDLRVRFLQHLENDGPDGMQECFKIISQESQRRRKEALAPFDREDLNRGYRQALAI